MYCKHCHKQLSQYTKEHYCDKAGQLNNDTDNFLVSSLIGYATNSAIVGGIIGGDIVGGIVGDILNGGGLFD